MKITKLMLSALVAAAALVSCNKEDHDPVDTKVKSISISLGNAIMTKGVSAGEIKEGTAVNVKNFNIFLVDKHGNSYQAKNSDGTDADTYIDLSSETIKEKYDFHYVDPAVTKVAIIANAGDVDWSEVKDSYGLEIGNQQIPSDLVLYGIDDQLISKGQKNHANGDVTVLYEAEVILYPTVSRFEVDGFCIAFGQTPMFNEVKVTQIAFQKYYPESDAVSGSASGPLVNHINDLSNESNVFNWFTDVPTEMPWYRDAFNLSLTPQSPVGKVGTTGLSYHFFAGDQVPVMMIDMLVDNRPAYVYSKSINVIDGSTTTQLTSLEAGKVYRMSAAGADQSTDPNGYIEIPEDVIDPANHCIDITVSVVDWVVTLVQPEF